MTTSTPLCNIHELSSVEMGSTINMKTCSVLGIKKYFSDENFDVQCNEIIKRIPPIHYPFPTVQNPHYSATKFQENQKNNQKNIQKNIQTKNQNNIITPSPSNSSVPSLVNNEILDIKKRKRSNEDN